MTYRPGPVAKADNRPGEAPVEWLSLSAARDGLVSPGEAFRFDVQRPVTAVSAAPTAGFIPSPGTPGISPNFSDWLYTNGLTIPAGTTYYTTSLYFMFTGTLPAPVFTNNGALWNVGANAWVIQSMNLGPVTNNGLMVADASAGGWAYGIEVTSNHLTIWNTGQIYALAGFGRALGISTWGFGVIYNNGLIAAQSLADIAPNEIMIMARGIERINGGQVLNDTSGRILVEGASAQAISIHRGHVAGPLSTDYADVYNAGLIQAVSTDPNRQSAGVVMGSADYEHLILENHGTIRADIAISMGYSPVVGINGLRFIDNYAGALIDGAILLSDLNEIISNAGAIRGVLTMAGGNDRINNSGSIIGLIDLGAGDAQ